MSFDTIGVVLSQLDGHGNEGAIAYGLNVMNKNGIGYFTRKELLAIYAGLFEVANKY